MCIHTRAHLPIKCTPTCVPKYTHMHLQTILHSSTMKAPTHTYIHMQRINYSSVKMDLTIKKRSIVNIGQGLKN